MTNTFPEWLRAMREARGLSPAQMGEPVGSISHWPKPSKCPSQRCMPHSVTMAPVLKTSVL